MRWWEEDQTGGPLFKRSKEQRAHAIMRTAAVGFAATIGITVAALVGLSNHAVDFIFGTQVAYLLIMALQYAQARYEAVQLTPDGIVVRRALQAEQLYRWHEIAWIWVTPATTSSRQQVQVNGAFGNVLLPAPMRAPDRPNPRFDDQVAAIFSWWAQHRSPRWAPPPGCLPPPPVPAS